MSKDYSEKELHEICDRVKGWHSAFAQSPHAAALTEVQRAEAPFVVESFAEHMYSYLSLRPKTWTAAGLEECCLDILPRKISAGAEYFESIAPVLAAFFAFLDERGLISNAGALTRRVTKIKAEIVEAAHDPRSWGIAKSLVMDAEAAGVDISDPKKLQEFITEYNAGLDADEMDDDEWDDDPLDDDEDDFFVPAPIVQAVSTKIGRNEPCPCGSGKKYKKCCALKN